VNEYQGVRLFDYWRSSSSYRVRIALSLLNLPVKLVKVDLLTGEQSGGPNLARNPQGLVPTLSIDGFDLTQSLAIIEYLDETRRAGFLPRDPLDRARVRALSMAIAMEIQPVCNLHVARYAVAQSDGKIDQTEWMRHFIARGLADFEAMLPDTATGYCFGQWVTMADICLVPQIYNARRWGVDLSDMPKSMAIEAHLAAFPAFALAAPVGP
jgi:maleylacetoacetate isomerase